MKPVTAVVMVALIAAVAVLGYLYYEETKNDVNFKIDVPNVNVE